MVDEPQPDRQDDPGDDRWDHVKDNFGDLGSKLRGFYDEAADDTETASDEMRDAVQTFVAAAERVGKTIQEAFGDPEVQETAKSAFNSLINALTDTFRETGSDGHDELAAGEEE